MKTHFIFFSLIGFGLGSGVANGAINPANPSQEKPAFIAIVKHHTDKIQKRVESDGTTTTSYTRVKDYNAQYQPNASDNDWAIKFHGTVNDYSQEPDSWRKTVYNWSEMANSTYTYSTNSDGTESFDPYIVESWCSRENSIVPDADLRSLGSPGYCDEIHVHWILHYYARKVKHHWDYPDGVKEEVGVNARTEMKLFTGGKSGVKRKSLIHITAGAEKNGDPYEYPWGYTPTTPVDATKIKVLGWWLFGRSLDNHGDLFIVLPDNTERDLNLRVPGVKHYDAEATAVKHKMIHQTTYPALTNPDLNRTTIGVGEEVAFYFDPSLPINGDWTASAGGLDANVAPNVQFTAPSNAATATVKVTVAGQSLKETFKVLEPSGFDHTLLTHTFPNVWPPGMVAVAMQNRVWIGPTGVSFYRVMISEFGEDANPVTGYFADTNKFTTNPGYWFHHWPGGNTNDDFAMGAD